jgi:protein O-GlcNAcase/histone acetyltransferase
LSNPNCEFEANYIPLRTLAAWRLAEKYDPRPAGLTALREWAIAWTSAVRPSAIETEVELREGATASGEGLVPAPSPSEQLVDCLELLCDCFYLPFEHGPRAAAFLVEFQHLLRTPPPAWGHDFKRFESTCAKIDLLFRAMTELENRDLLHALYRHVWELKEETHLLLNYLNWLQANPGIDGTFASAEHRPKTYRGGLVAELQRLLPMNNDGGFNHRPPLISKHDPNPYR